MFAFRRIPSLLRLSTLDAGAAGAAELSAWNRAERLPLEKAGNAEALHTAGTCSCGMAHAAGVYNEEAFHYLLSVEYKRFARSQRPFVLALIEETAVAPEVFAALAHALRETDVIGWYRDGRVVGALLTHLGDPPVAEVSRLMSGKITRALQKELPGASANRLTAKLYQPYEESWS